MCFQIKLIVKTVLFKLCQKVPKTGEKSPRNKKPCSICYSNLKKLYILHHYLAQKWRFISLY